MKPTTNTMPSASAESLNNNIKEAPATTSAKAQKKRRWKSGTVALREIKKLQKNEKHVIPRETIRRCITEIVHTLKTDCLVASDAVEALRTAAEAALSQTFGLAGALCSEISKTRTVDLAEFRAAANILHKDHIFSTAGLAAGALTATLV